MELVYIKNEDLILIRTNDSLGRDAIVKLIRETVKYADQYNCYQILFDHRDCKIEAEKKEIFDITRNLSEHGITFNHVCAVVFNIDGNKYRFADTVIENLSGGTVRFFDDYETAKRWVLKNKK